MEPYGRIHVFYDSPILENGKWTLARQLGGEIPHYMFPELEEGCCQKFIGMIGDLENNLPKALELINANDIKKQRYKIMKKIMFNDKYCLTESVIEGRKTQTRRILNPTMFFQRLETYEGWSNEDIGAWKRSCNRRFYEAKGDNLQQMLDYALKSSRYKIGDVVAIAQSYKDIHAEIRKEVGDWDLKKEFLQSKGYTNKMFVRADKMPHRIRITDIRIEQLQDISEDDCLAEGIWRADNVGLEGTTYWYHGLANSFFRTPQ